MEGATRGGQVLGRGASKRPEGGDLSNSKGILLGAMSLNVDDVFIFEGGSFILGNANIQNIQPAALVDAMMSNNGAGVREAFLTRLEVLTEGQRTALNNIIPVGKGAHQLGRILNQVPVGISIAPSSLTVDKITQVMAGISPQDFFADANFGAMEIRSSIGGNAIVMAIPNNPLVA